MCFEPGQRILAHGSADEENKGRSSSHRYSVTPLRRYLLIIVAMISVATCASAQHVRFSNHRELAVPEYALLRIGPFYSNVGFSQSAGYRYTRSRGTGTDFLTANRRGVIDEDGAEFPLVSTLNFRNYLLITRNMDLDASIRMSYEVYPLGTQDNAFNVDLPEEGIEGSLSTEFRLTPFVRGTAYDNFFYRTDYIDTRGLEDIHGGQAYEYMRNSVGVNLDWLMAHGHNMAVSVVRRDEWPQEDEFEDKESTSYSEHVAYEYQINQFLVGGLDGAFSQTDYQMDSRSDFSSQQYSVFARAQVTRKISGRVWAGYALAASSGSEEEESSDDGDVTGGVSLEGDQDAVTFVFGLPLRHRLAVDRKLQGGYESAYEVVDTIRYSVSAEAQGIHASFLSDFRTVDPSSDNVSSYSDWGNTLDLSYPLSQLINLYFSSTYRIRYNDGIDDEGDVEEEWSEDYATWSTKVGTGFPVTKKINFETFYNHVRRMSDSESLDYQRDIFQAFFTYSHQF